MNKDFNPLCLGKRKYEVLNTFQSYLCSSCYKSSPLKATENEITNAFEHSDYINVGYYNDIRDALTVLGSMFNVDSHKSITVGG
jgi:hypothetical protein